MKRVVLRPKPLVAKGARGSVGCSAQSELNGRTPRHKPTVEALPSAIPLCNRLVQKCDHEMLPYRVQYGPSLMQLSSIKRGAVRLRTTERPNGAESAARKPSPEEDKNKKEDSFHFIMRLPFLYAHTLAKTESHWLKQRNRSRWWKRGHFPKIPRDTVGDAMKDETLQPSKILSKMLALGVVFFCATFNLCILQNVKDTIMITQVGAETLPFLAGFGVLPATVVFFTFYNKLVNNLPVKSVFYAAIAPLLSFYAFFALVLYPAAPYLHPHGFINATAQYFPVGFHGLLQCIENWTFSAFFCVGELWGAVVISVLFWSLANDVCTVNEAKTIYPLMGISANIALVVAGTFIKNLPKLSTLTSLRLLMGAVLAMSVVMMAGKLYLDKKILPHLEDEGSLKNLKKPKKSKGTMKEGLSVLRESPKIMNLALLVIGCSVSHRLFDVAWKGQLKLVYPTALEYQSVLADVSVWTGMCTIGMMIGGKFIFQYIGWGFAAATTPVVMLLSGCVFFAFSIMYNSGAASAQLAAVGAVAGNITQVVCKSAKYSLFDPAKEMVYIEMSKEEKSKGKAAVDLVGNQVGKTGASWMSQGLLLTFGSIPASMPCIAALYTGVIAVWTAAVFKLRNELKKTEEERELSSAGDGSTTNSIDEESSKQPILKLDNHAEEEHSGNGATPASNSHNGALNPPNGSTDVTSATGAGTKGLR